MDSRTIDVVGAFLASFGMVALLIGLWAALREPPREPEKPTAHMKAYEAKIAGQRSLMLAGEHRPRFNGYEMTADEYAEWAETWPSFPARWLKVWSTERYYTTHINA